MGIGGGFLLVPAMIYLLGMPTALVAGTSLFQIIFVTAIATFLQAAPTTPSMSCWRCCLLVGGVVGAQFGTALRHPAARRAAAGLAGPAGLGGGGFAGASN